MSMFSKSKITDPIDPKSDASKNGAQPAAATPSAPVKPAAKPETLALGNAAPAASQSFGHGSVTVGGPSLINADLKVVGSLHTVGDLEIEGIVDGDVNANTLTIGQSAQINGEVIGNQVTVKGRVNGRVRGVSVHLTETARLDGDILHKSMAIDTGAQFQGSVSMSEDPLGTDTIAANGGTLPTTGIAPAGVNPGIVNAGNGDAGNQNAGNVSKLTSQTIDAATVSKTTF